MGVVYRAKDTRLNRIVAYKMLMEQFMEVKDVRDRFLREAQSAAQLNHPNIVTVFDMDVDAEQNRLFIAMEFVAGESYFEILQRETRLSIQQTVHFVVGVRTRALWPRETDKSRRPHRPGHPATTCSAPSRNRNRLPAAGVANLARASLGYRQWFVKLPLQSIPIGALEPSPTPQRQSHRSRAMNGLLLSSPTHCRGVMPGTRKV